MTLMTQAMRCTLCCELIVGFLIGLTMVADRRSGDRLSAMPGFTDSPVEGAVRSELVSEAKFPASRENTGNFIDFGLGHLNLSSKLPL